MKVDAVITWDLDKAAGEARELDEERLREVDAGRIVEARENDAPDRRGAPEGAAQIVG